MHPLDPVLVQLVLDQTQGQHASIDEMCIRDSTAAVRQGLSPDGQAGMEIAALHKQWLGAMWPRYEREAHVALAEGYVCDPRFTAYYDEDQPG